MSLEDETLPDEDPDIVAERIIAALNFLNETAQATGLVFLVKPLSRCLSTCQIEYLKDKRRRFPSDTGTPPPKKPKNGT